MARAADAGRRVPRRVPEPSRGKSSIDMAVLVATPTWRVSFLDVLLLVISGLTLIASAIAAGAALLSLRQPKLEVEQRGLVPFGYAPYGGRILDEQ